MKRIIFFFAALSLSLALCAQTSADTTGIPQDGPKLKVDLGIEAGYSMFLKEASPYSANSGFLLRLPLMAHINLSDRWQFNTGLRYDFEWNTLIYNVEPADAGGLAIQTAATTGRQTARMHHSYLGIPVQIVWFPRPTEHRIMGIGLDIYAAYSVSRYLKIHNRDARDTYFGIRTASSTTVVESDDPMFQPWKLEVGLTVSTDVIGLLHGIRLFTNLLPTYIDPATNQRIYTSGITLFL